MDKDFVDLGTNALSHSGETKHSLKYLVSYDLRRLIFGPCIQYVLLKEGILPVHMGTIEQTIPINYVFPVSFTDVQSIIILLVL